MPGRVTAFRSQALEAAEIRLLQRDVEQVATPAGDQGAGAEGVAQLRNVVLQCRSCRSRRTLAPEPVGEFVAR